MRGHWCCKHVMYREEHVEVQWWLLSSSIAPCRAIFWKLLCPGHLNSRPVYHFSERSQYLDTQRWPSTSFLTINRFIYSHIFTLRFWSIPRSKTTKLFHPRALGLCAKAVKVHAPRDCLCLRYPCGHSEHWRLMQMQKLEVAHVPLTHPPAHLHDYTKKSNAKRIVQS